MMSLIQEMKTCITKSLIIALLATIIIIPAGNESLAATSFNVSATVNSKEGAYLRNGPSKSNKAVALLKNGTNLTIVSEHFTTTNSTIANNRWYYVTSGNKKGYIRADLVKNITHKQVRLAWSKDALNCRYGAGTGMALKGAFKKDSPFYVVLPAYAKGSKTTWYKVSANSSFYYVCGSYVTFTRPKTFTGKVTSANLGKLASVVQSSDQKSMSTTQSAASQKVCNGAVAWAIKIANDNSFHYGNGQHAHHNGCYYCGTQPTSKRRNVVRWEKTYCCNPFVHAAYAHGGNEQTMLKLCKRGNSYDWDTIKTKTKLFKALGHPAKSTLKKGDVLCYNGHMAMYVGNGNFVEAAGGDDGKPYSSKWNRSIAVKKLTDKEYRYFTHVYRYIGKN